MKYTHIVVGAGSAGAALATRLSEDPERSVLLLEAGPDYPDLETMPVDLKFGWGTGADFVVEDEHNWKYTAKSTAKGPTMDVPRGKVTGGTSAINGQVFLRAIPEDFEYWVSMGNDEWSYEQVLPYYRKLETDTDFSDDFHGTEGPIIVRRHPLDELQPDQAAFYNACVAAGYAENPDHNHPDATGVGPYPLNNPEGIRWSTAIGFLSMARHRINLTIRPNCTTRRVLFDDTRATGVEVESGGESFVVNGDEIILSAGPIGSPHLLMLSGIGPADQLAEHGISLVKDVPGVGQNLRDHPTVHVSWRAQPDVPAPPQEVGPQKVALRYTAPGSDIKNDMIKVMRFRKIDRLLVMSVGLYLALGKGELKLQSPDPDVQPSLDYNYLQEPEDRRRLREGVRLCLELVDMKEFEKVVGERVNPDDAALASDNALDEWLMRSVSTMHHISCTAKMGPDSDPMAVVDQHGRVKGVQSLRVVDGSIMPDCTRANTNVPIMMMAERIADFIKAGE
ncbi:MAG TPA: mycofactocin system GMC family oxidoreductase MftG [Dehalococcoidia bacterium]|nr:mycofactocin system GMC family oxidoreductase MftG [Dehalococcoidia bacterium]HIM15915.1 mycofactocin system GMC family oxidoreductase MftG [Dehalococcoidia bacterium]